MNQCFATCMLMGLFTMACSGEAPESTGAAQAALSPHDFDVDFSNCSEVAGIGFVPAANARPLVPSSYTLAGDAQNAVLVARAVSCEGASVDGKKARSTISSQIGISVVGPDTSADINNYTLWFETDHPQLAAKLGGAGADADHAKPTYTVTTGGSPRLDFVAAPNHTPRHELHGPIVLPTAAAAPFVATWWFDGQHGTVRMRTTFPAIRFSSASMTLTTPAGSALANVIGGTSLTFALLDSYNTFATAKLEVRIVE